LCSAIIATQQSRDDRIACCKSADRLLVQNAGIDPIERGASDQLHRNLRLGLKNSHRMRATVASPKRNGVDYPARACDHCLRAKWERWAWEERDASQVRSALPFPEHRREELCASV
jgi:hypothetical protein